MSEDDFALIISLWLAGRKNLLPKHGPSPYDKVSVFILAYHEKHSEEDWSPYPDCLCRKFMNDWTVIPLHLFKIYQILCELGNFLKVC